MRPIWKLFSPSQLGATLEEVKKNLGGFTIEMATDLQRILNSGATVKDNLAMTYIEFDAIHGMEARVANPFKSVPQAFIPISAFSLTGGTNGVGARNTGVQIGMAGPPILNTSRTDGFLGITVNYSTTTEVVSASRLRSAQVGILSGGPNNVIAVPSSIIPGPGTWQIAGTVAFSPNTPTTVTDMHAAISKASATLPVGDTLAVPAAGELRARVNVSAGVIITGGEYSMALPRFEAVFTTATPLFLIAQATFAASTLSVYGFIEAYRIGPDPATTAHVRGILVEA